MPSYQYLREESPNLPSSDPPPEYTKKEKAKNWWHYHWLIVVGVIIGVALIAYFIVSMVFQTKPDYTVGIITTADVSAELTEKLSQELVPFFDDKNGDGQVIIDVISYSVTYSDEEESTSNASSEAVATPKDPYSQMAGVTKLSGALASNDQFIFLVDPAQAAFYQEAFGIFGNPDGTVPDEDADLSQLAPLLKNCPTLSQLDLKYSAYTDTEIDGQDSLGDFYITLRPVYGTAVEKRNGGIENWETNKKIYQTLIENATY